MRKKLGWSVIVWKLSAACVAIIAGVISISGYIDNRADERYAIESAREVSKFNAEVILESTRKLMMTRDNLAIKELIDNLAKDNHIYRDIRLVSHEGEIAASKSDPQGTLIKQGARSCRVCHDLPDPADRIAIKSHDSVVELAGGDRLVSVITPVLNEPGCKAAACHAHADSGPLLGFLQTDFSLSRTDALLSLQRTRTVLTAVTAILLSILALWLVMDRLIERPIQKLTTGMLSLARNDFSHRIQLDRDDEMGLLAGSFNNMAMRLSGSISELRETKDYLEGLVKHSADIIITVDNAGLIRTFNEGAEKALAYKEDEVVGTPMETLFLDPLERDAAIAKLKDNDNVVNLETRFLAKTGEARNVILTISRLRKPDGTPLGTYGISKDITLEKRLIKKLMRSEKFTAIGQAFTGILHSTKNVLNALKGGAYMVKVGLANDDKKVLKEGWEMVQEGISNMSDISKSMLSYVREHAPEVEETRIEEIARKVCSVMKATAKDQGVNLTLEIAPDVAAVKCDPQQIHSAVMDLVSNALDACDLKSYADGAAPEIKVMVRPCAPDGMTVLEVRDNGCGMTEDVRENIFTPFFSTKKNSGTGLGLALTSRIIGEHGGVLRVDSTPKKGTSFRIGLPYGETNESARRNCMAKKVLVIDDDKNVRKFLTVALEQNGFEHAIARDGVDGLTNAKEAKPDLIVLDVMMPKKTGFVLFKQLRKDEALKDIPVIMLTGVGEVLEEQERGKSDTLESPYDALRESMKKAVDQMRDEGISRPELFLDKPIDPEKFIEKVKELLGS